MAFRDQMWQVIEWKDDSSNLLAYRFPHSGKEIISGSSLTVRESQVAIFVHLGKIADVFGPGKYKLETKNLPLLSGLGAIFYQNKQSRFKAEVYFVNTKQFTNQKWGTSSPITLRDKDFGVIRIKAFGTYSFKVSDAKILMQELLGTKSSFTVDDINAYLKSMLISTITDTIAESKVGALELSANLQEFNDMCVANVGQKFISIGLEIVNFVIENVSFPESVEKAIDERSALGILSDKMGTYTQKKAADALGDAARNSGGAAGMFVGMGMGQNAGSALGGAFSNISNAEDEKEKVEEDMKFCSECGAKMRVTAKFCPECGAKVSGKDACPKCGAVVKKGSKFCPDCGTKL
ncbi:MAG TPA: SPFH domain-containing protein [Eubacteriales bacterium]|nr:SPFH domain-containing protein [Eubacteriales bacterium]